jgi:hypothetical protein
MRWPIARRPRPAEPRHRIPRQERLREPAHEHGDQITIFSAHDPVELRSLQHHRAGVS